MNKPNINSIQWISRNLYLHLLKSLVQSEGARSLIAQSLNLALKRFRPPLGHKLRLHSLSNDHIELLIPQYASKHALGLERGGSDSDETLMIAARTAFLWLIHKNIHDQNLEIEFTEYHIQRLNTFSQGDLHVRQQMEASDLELVRLDLSQRRQGRMNGSVLFFTEDNILVARIDAVCQIGLKSELSWGKSDANHHDH